MSHFTVLVVGDDVDDLLDPFSEHLEVDHVITKQGLIDGEKRSMDYYLELDEKYQADPEEYAEKCSHSGHLDFVRGQMQDMIHSWTDDDWHKHALRFYDESARNEDGSINSTYNPKSKWDWYQVGGRWSDSLKVKPHSKSGSSGERSWSLDGIEHVRGFADSALKGDVDWKHESMKDFSAFAFLGKNGEWAEEGEMGWFGVSTTEDENWGASFKRLLADVGDDERITIVDCHI